MTVDTAFEIAQQASELFVARFMPTAPFRRESLRVLWEDCGRDPALTERRGRGRSAVETAIGPLDVEGVAPVPEPVAAP